MGMKAMKAKKSTGRPMSKGGIAEALAAECELKRAVCSKVLDSLAAIATTEVKGTGLFYPGLGQDQDTDEAGNQGWEEGGLRQDDDGEGEAGKENCEGLPRVSLEEEHLRRCAQRRPWPVHRGASRGAVLWAVSIIVARRLAIALYIFVSRV